MFATLLPRVLSLIHIVVSFLVGALTLEYLLYDPFAVEKVCDTRVSLLVQHRIKTIKSSPKPEARKAIGFRDFHLLKVLGVGSMGKVFLVKHKRSREVFAMKVISKKLAIDKREVKHIREERDILTEVECPFLVKMWCAFQTTNSVCMVMSYCCGGDLAYHLGRRRTFSPELSMFLAAEICLGLRELHKRGIVYRDLKPENVLLDQQGHVVLADFGLSKKLKGGKTRTFCGTAEYLAVEVLRGDEYGLAVDWWSFGVMLYEFIVGAPPFCSTSHSLLYRRIVCEAVSFPDALDDNARDLVAKLLVRDPTQRLGGGSEDANE
eukprot:Colp12_sorted_trinity150504_noHs@25763